MVMAQNPDKFPRDDIYPSSNDERERRTSQADQYLESLSFDQRQK